MKILDKIEKKHSDVCTFVKKSHKKYLTSIILFYLTSVLKIQARMESLSVSLVFYDQFCFFIILKFAKKEYKYFLRNKNKCLLAVIVKL